MQTNGIAHVVRTTDTCATHLLSHEKRDAS